MSPTASRLPANVEVPVKFDVRLPEMTRAEVEAVPETARLVVVADVVVELVVVRLVIVPVVPVRVVRIPVVTERLVANRFVEVALVLVLFVDSKFGNVELAVVDVAVK